MELTKEYFDQVVSGLATKDELASLATKHDLSGALAATETRIITRIDEAQEQLARMVSAGFEDVQSRLNVEDRVARVEAKLEKITQALHLEL